MPGNQTSVLPPSPHAWAICLSSLCRCIWFIIYTGHSPVSNLIWQTAQGYLTYQHPDSFNFKILTVVQDDLCFYTSVFLCLIYFLSHGFWVFLSNLFLWMLYWLCIFLVSLGVPADGLAELASNFPPWGRGHFLCAPLPFLLLTEALIPLAAVCLHACLLPANSEKNYCKI